MTDSWLDLIESNRRESQKIVSLRDMTLPRLVSGEIRLRDIERMVKMDMTDRPNRDTVR